MKKKHVIISIVAIVILIVLVIFVPKRPAIAPTTDTVPSTSTTTQPAADQIMFPTQSNTLVLGKTYTLRWNGGQNPIDIFLVDEAYKSVGVSVSLVDRVYHVPNTGSYSYTVPTYLKPGAYQFEIGQMTSDTFRIVAQ